MSSHTRILFSILAAALLIAGCKSKPSNPPDSAPAAVAVDPSAATIEENKKLTAIDWALKQDEIKNDPNGQWAVDASASSSYNDAKGDAAWSPTQVTGPPNVEHYGDDGKAWAPKTPDGGIEWLDLKYAKAVNATEVRIRESCGSGAVIQVELFDEQGNSHKVWRGTDPTQELNYFVLKVAPANYKTNRVKITLATNAVPGWNEIDAVQLVGK